MEKSDLIIYRFKISNDPIRTSKSKERTVHHRFYDGSNLSRQKTAVGRALQFVVEAGTHKKVI